MAAQRRPRVALTVGDPAGIGPEIAAKAAADSRVLEACEPIIYAPPSHVQVSPGTLSPESGRAAYDCVVRAVADARRGAVDAIATAPVNKLAWARAGLPWKGHTDLLAHLCGGSRVAMLFHAPELIVVLATVHVPLADVPRVLTSDLMFDTLALTAASMPDFGVTRARIAVAGLNPHAGEDGLLGHEDRDVLQPAIDRARSHGMDVTGPLPADTVFTRAVRGEFDVVIACYHDQGLIPVKLLSFGRAVNVTIGLPIVRTSVDHGTAFDIAGRGVADPGSMIEATVLAARLARARSERTVS
jgi:4-hydroxythreonine-4-phosphate dehydrogenase